MNETNALQEKLGLSAPPRNSITEQDLQRILSEYVANVLPLRQRLFKMGMPEENINGCLFGQEQYLLISNFKMHELPFSLLRRLPIYLVRQFVVQVELDSFWFWALTHDVVRTAIRFSPLNQWELLENFDTLMASHFASLNVSPRFQIPALERLNRTTYEIVSQPVRDLVGNTSTVLMYICYPVLEGLARFALSPLINDDGVANYEFTDGYEIFSPNNRGISSLGKILRSLEINGTAKSSVNEFSDNLRDFKLEIEKVNLPKPSRYHDGWDSVYNLRNKALHGSVGWQMRSGLITNLVCLIIWNLLDDSVLNAAMQNFPHRMPFPSFYYPPEKY